MDGVWLTYHELAEKLGTSAEGARRRAQRGRWARQRGNDGLARVMVPNDALDGPRPVRALSAPPSDPALTDALREANTALTGHIETLKDENGRLAQQLAEAQAQASAAIAAFASLADRLDALAAERARPWWKRMVG